eukprot:scaffold492_cov341-Pavlova_lutheri.AAC.22
MLLVHRQHPLHAPPITHVHQQPSRCFHSCPSTILGAVDPIMWCGMGLDPILFVAKGSVSLRTRRVDVRTSKASKNAHWLGDVVKHRKRGRRER